MVREESTKSGFPSPGKHENKTYNLLSKFQPGFVDSLSEISKPDLPLDKDDLSLPNLWSIDVLGKLFLTPIETYAETEDILSVEVVSDNYTQKELLSRIKEYPAEYRGQITPMAEWGCNMVARRLNDMYDPETHRFQRRKFLDNNYLEIIAKEAEKGRTLIAFDEDWVIAGVQKYFSTDASVSIDNPEELREVLLENRPVKESTTEVEVWDTSIGGGTGQKEKQLPFNPIRSSFYTFASSEIFPAEFSGTVDLYTPYIKGQTVMIFAPVTLEEASHIWLYLYRDASMFSFDQYVVVKDMSPAQAVDFQYLFPVSIEVFGDYLIISSEILSRKQLLWALRRDTTIFPYPRLPEKVAVFAAYLLAEATNYQFEIIFNQRCLFLSKCGYLQAIDLKDYYNDLVNQIYQEGLDFQKLNDFYEAVGASKDGNKSFLYQGEWYTFGTMRIYRNVVDLDPSELELFGLLESIQNGYVRSLALKALSLIGYNTQSDTSVKTQLKLGYRTYQIDGYIYTSYYYLSSADIEIEIHETFDKYNLEIDQLLTQLVNVGFFFDQKTKNVAISYDGYILTSAAVRHDLPRDQNKLLSRLRNIVKLEKSIAVE